MWAGSSRTDVLLGHAALLWRSPSLCCLHSRHLHSLHCCLKSFKSSSLSPRLLLYRSLPPSLSAQTLPLPCCLEMKRSENGDNGEGGGGVLPEEDERGERSEGRGGRQGNDEVCLGYFGFLWLLCSASVLSLLPHSKLKEKRFWMHLTVSVEENVWFRCVWMRDIVDRYYSAH